MYIMKICRIFLLSGFISACFVSLQAQWVKQNSGTSSFLNDVSFINSNTGWTCGNGGTILKTTNAGTNWTAQYSGVPNKLLYAIHAVDSNIAYCVGWFETVLKTTNGGANWMALRNGPEGTAKSYFGLYFINPSTGWLLANHYVIRTTNGGMSFDSTYTVYSYLEDVYFRDSMNGVLCGDGSLIMKSTDGGVSWNQITIPLFNGELPDFFKLSFISNTGWIVARGSNNPNLGRLVYKTTNLGASWDTIGRVPYPQGTEAYCVFFSGLNTGWTGGSYGHMYKTTNGGLNWSEQLVGGGYKSSIYFVNDNTGWAVGADTGSGLIVYTSSGGQYLSVTQIGTTIPGYFQLYQNYPNPFNNSTAIEFSVPKSDYYKLEIYDLLGRKVRTVFDQFLQPANYKTLFDADNFASGTYFYSLYSANFRVTKKFILIK